MSGDQPGVWRPPTRVTTFSADAIGQVGADAPARPGADAIVRALAAQAPIETGYADRAVGDEPGYDCAFKQCAVAGYPDELEQRPEMHRPSCPYRLAVEWVAEHPEATP